VVIIIKIKKIAVALMKLTGGYSGVVFMDRIKKAAVAKLKLTIGYSEEIFIKQDDVRSCIPT
jgi:hypothetical protein